MQALIIAYGNDFRMLTFFALLALPVAFVIGPTKATFNQRIQRASGGAKPPPQKPHSEPRIAGTFEHVTGLLPCPAA